MPHIITIHNKCSAPQIKQGFFYSMRQSGFSCTGKPSKPQDYRLMPCLLMPIGRQNQTRLMKYIFIHSD
jgi:hypothetical protein